MIGVSTTGHKFPPFVIFKGTKGIRAPVWSELSKVNLERENLVRRLGNIDGNEGSNVLYETAPLCCKFPLQCIYDVQEKAWMSEKLMLKWIEKVWKPWADKQVGTTMCIIDEFRGHLTTAVRCAVSDCDTVLVIIPGGYTSKLQVMDVGLNKPFKEKIRRHYQEWFMVAVANQKKQQEDANEQARLAAENGLPVPPRITIRAEKPTRPSVSEWLNKAWYGITETTISNTWRKIFGLYEFDDDDDVYEQEQPHESDAGVVFIDNENENNDELEMEPDQMAEVWSDDEEDHLLVDDPFVRVVRNDDGDA
jgi:hypothetical protein